MNKNASKVLFVGLGALWAGLFVAPPASSEVIAAAAGDMRRAVDRSCMQYEFGRARNTSCNGRPLLTVAPRAITGSRTFRATGSSYGGGADVGVSCAAIVTNISGWQVWSSGQVYMSGGPFSSPTPVTLGTRSVASNQGVIFECLMGKDSSFDWLGTVEY